MCEPWYVIWEQDKPQSKIYWILEAEEDLQGLRHFNYWEKFSDEETEAKVSNASQFKARAFTSGTLPTLSLV